MRFLSCSCCLSLSENTFFIAAISFLGKIAGQQNQNITTKLKVNKLVTGCFYFEIFISTLNDKKELQV
jgi:hypothetical protein